MEFLKILEKFGTKIWEEIFANLFFCFLIGIFFVVISFLVNKNANLYFISGSVLIIWAFVGTIKYIKKNFKKFLYIRKKIKKELCFLNMGEISILRPMLQHGVKTWLIENSLHRKTLEYNKDRMFAESLKKKGFVNLVDAQGLSFSITITDHAWNILNRRYKKEGNFLESDYNDRFSNRNKNDKG